MTTHQVSADTQAALDYLAAAQQQVDQIPDVPATKPRLPITRVGVVGAGTMGGGIAMCFANAGIPVTIMEVAGDALERGLGTIRRNYESSVKRGRITQEQAEQRLANIQGSLQIDDLAQADLIIEAVFENMEVKQDLLRRLDAIAKPGAILASNTSFLNIDDLAAVTKRPENVLGLHFFSPANVMALLEIVRGAKTSATVIATALDLAKKIGKVGVLVRVCHGFAGNRLISVRRAQGQTLLLEGALPWQVDKVLEEFGFPMGPFAMSDLAGLDIGWSAELSRSESVRDVLCEMGRRGQKTQAGYYDYDENRTRTPSPVAEAAIRKFWADHQLNTRVISDTEILQRCLFPMINEAFRLLEENIVIRASDIDVVMINGYGWPKHRGGLMYYADSIGLPVVLEMMEKLHAQFGESMQPAKLLRVMAASGAKVYQYRAG